MPYFFFVPTIALVFAAIFAGVSLLDRSQRAPRWAALLFAVTALGFGIDALRTADAVWMRSAAMTAHLVASFAAVRALQVRHRIAPSPLMVALLVIVPLLLTPLMPWSEVRLVRRALLYSTCLAFLLIGLRSLLGHRRAIIDRVVLGFVVAVIFSYVAMIVIAAFDRVAPSPGSHGFLAGGLTSLLLVLVAIKGLVGAVVLLLAVLIDIIGQHERDSVVDPLTRVANRRAVDRLVEEDRSGRTHVAAAIVIDLDLFKRINDAHGHDTGDRVLMAVALALSDALGMRGMLARMGGEEFVALIGDVDRAAAPDIAASLLSAVRQVRLPAHPDLRPTASMGLAWRRPGDSVREMIHQADVALYDAKARGRDQLVIADPAPLRAIAGRRGHVGIAGEDGSPDSGISRRRARHRRPDDATS